MILSDWTAEHEAADGVGLAGRDRACAGPGPLQVEVREGGVRQDQGGEGAMNNMSLGPQIAQLNIELWLKSKTITHAHIVLVQFCKVLLWASLGIAHLHPRLT